MLFKYEERRDTIANTAEQAATLAETIGNKLTPNSCKQAFLDGSDFGRFFTIAEDDMITGMVKFLIEFLEHYPPGSILRSSAEISLANYRQQKKRLLDARTAQ